MKRGDKCGFLFEIEFDLALRMSCGAVMAWFIFSKGLGLEMLSCVLASIDSPERKMLYMRLDVDQVRLS
jgi:hypothetical protein